MKLTRNIQSVKRMIAAFALGITLLVGVLGMLPTAKQTEAVVAKIEQAEEIARYKVPFNIVPLANFWSG